MTNGGMQKLLLHYSVKFHETFSDFLWHNGDVHLLFIFFLKLHS